MDPAQEARRGIPPSGGRIAFFGGSFDPPHLGHLAIARAARNALDLDAVLFAPVGAQPLKPQGSAAAFADRLAMTRLAIAGEPGFALSLADAPQSADGPSCAPNYTPNYSFDTLERLTAGLGSGTRLFCLMGADSFLGLRQWHRAAEIPFLAPLIVASRPGQPLNELRSALPGELNLEPAKRENKNGIELETFTIAGPIECRGELCGERHAPFYVLPGLNVEISASDIRAQLRSGDDPDLVCVLPAPVADYIKSHNLYR